MKNRIDSTFENLKAQNKKAFIPFVTAGDSTIEETYEIVRALSENGADIIELGIPFSDPIAEGPVIQEANLRAKDATLPDIFNLVKRLRTEKGKEIETPLLYLMYYNQVLHYGVEEFLQECNRCGVDGLIIPDLPFEEKDEIGYLTEKYSVHHISLIAPTSKDRMKKICESAKGFLYCVSSTGVTGMRAGFNTNFAEFFEEINKHVKVPTALGFGISTKEQAQELKQYADGIIIGSALVNLLKDAEDKVKTAGAFTREIRSALD